MTTTFVTRTADLMPALQPALAQAAAQALCVMTAAPVQGTGLSVAASRTRLVVDVIASAEHPVAVIGTRQVSPVYGTPVVGSNGSVVGSNGSAVFGKGDVPALRTWRPPV
ncbi:MAG TPA: hypothetical protein VFS29_11080 [Motilibacteraceae bacterium]|nr:hypothetical protein [Motilibacteraceae bacterium]